VRGSIFGVLHRKWRRTKKARYGERFDLVGTPDAIIEGLRRYAQVGSQYVTFHMPDAQEVEPILLLGETVVAQAAEL
jgi:alkanesulfonate monooxygenase SsuD/methylene tetrahydromethanopterin reductase-like flavin-dependent oxidoreductase (luciferase family)